MAAMAAQVSGLTADLDAQAQAAARAAASYQEQLNRSLGITLPRQAPARPLEPLPALDTESRAADIAARMRVGTVNVNGGVWYSADMPFGGYKQSGIGREMGLAGFDEYLETKAIATGV